MRGFIINCGVDEIALLHLQQLYSLSVRICMLHSLLLKAKQNSELNVCWNMIFPKILGYH